MQKNTISYKVRIPPTSARRTLGVILAPDRNCKTQISHSLRKAKEFLGKIRNSFLSQKRKWVAFNSVIEPAILYPMVNTLFHTKDISPVVSVLSQMQCSALGLNRNFHCAVHHGPMSLDGLGVPPADQKITRDRVYFLFNMWRTSTISCKFNISLIYTQLEIGLFCQFFSSSYLRCGHLTTTSIGIQIWSELEPLGIHLCPAQNIIWTPPPLAKGDTPIMEIATKVYDKKGSLMINRCRMFLNIISLFDLLLWDRKGLLFGGGGGHCVSQRQYKNGQKNSAF